jgi:hypothetical protein
MSTIFFLWLLIAANAGCIVCNVYVRRAMLLKSKDLDKLIAQYRVMRDTYHALRAGDAMAAPTSNN